MNVLVFCPIKCLIRTLLASVCPTWLFSIMGPKDQPPVQRSASLSGNEFIESSCSSYSDIKLWGSTVSRHVSWWENVIRGLQCIRWLHGVLPGGLMGTPSVTASYERISSQVSANISRQDANWASTGGWSQRAVIAGVLPAPFQNSEYFLFSWSCERSKSGH